MEIHLKPSTYTFKINKKEIIKNLLDFNLGSVLTEIVEIDDTKERKAFLLMFTAVQKTNASFARNYGQEVLNNTYNLINIVSRLESEIKLFLEQEVKITYEFFKDVLKDNNNYIIEAYNVFYKFCKEIGIYLPLDTRLKYYHEFRLHLEAEFQENKEKYKELVDFFDNPIFEQNVNFVIMMKYYTSIKNFFTNKLQNNDENKETLQELYIEPFFEIYKNNLKQEFTSERNDRFLQPCNINIHEFFNNYFLVDRMLEELKGNYDMIFLLGQPGQGKTSFCYKLIFDYLENNQDLPSKPIFFVKIRELVAKDFISSPFETIDKHIPRLIDLESEEGILILDGLDEAYMSGGINENDLRNLYERLKKRPNKKLKIILTSRFSYLQVDDSCLDDTLILQLSNLSDQQILDYSKNFNKFYPDNQFINQVELVLSDDKYLHVKELLQQAVLIYFIGISNILIEEKDSKAKIYDKIFDAMAQRSWDKNNGQLDYINSKMKNNSESYKKHLRNYLSSLAFEIYQSPQLFITLKQLSELESTKNFVKKCFQKDLLDSPDKIKEINKYLLISFYFQESKNSDSEDGAIEFFHNSLFEYLTAEFFWEQNKKLLLQIDEDGDLKEVKYQEYFELLNKLTGDKGISSSVYDNLVEIISSESDEINNLVFDQSKKNFYKLSQLDFLLKFDKSFCVLTSREKTLEIFRLFWCFLNASNKKDIIEVNSGIFEYIIDSYGFSDIFLMNLNIYTGRPNRIFLIDSSKLICTHFTATSLKIEFYNSLVQYTKFYIDDLMSSVMMNNKFNNVTFKNCYLGSYANVISENEFVNCIFDHVEIDDEYWFEEFCKDNYLDEETRNNHFIKTIHTGQSSNVYIVNRNQAMI